MTLRLEFESLYIILRGEFIMDNSKKTLPLIPLRGITVFPNMVISFSVGRQKSLDAVEKATKGDEVVFLVSQKDPSVDSPKIDDICSVGTIAKVKQILKLPGNMTHIIVEGIERGSLLSIVEDSDCDMAEVEEIPQDFPEEPDVETLALMRMASDFFDEYIKMDNKMMSVNESVVNVISATKPGQMADIMASGLNIPQPEKQDILEILNPVDRLESVFEIINSELSIIRLKRELEEKVKRNIDKAQKEYYLREELKAIQDELGDKDGIGKDIERYRKALAEKNIPKEAKEVIEREISKFSRYVQSSPDANVSRNYLDWVTDMPWGDKTEEKLDIKKAQKVLDKDHYGLEKVKERILEYLAVIKNTKDLNTPILCLYGPPGVGKTSIARSIAKALNRKYVRMSLGGVKDESEIRGHRKTYIGAMPGRIIKSIKQAGVDNPLILLDEIDKLSSSYNGDPSSALLEVLDGEQNSTFRDHYMEVDYDLSDVLFICTANSLETIAPALRDRMEIIELSGYTSEEKRNIFKNHIYPKELKKYSLKKSNIKITDSAIDDIIDGYTREAGVRQLERVMDKICRKTVKSIVSGDKKSISVKSSNIEEILGKKKIKQEKIFDEPQVGIVRGLAWTQFGGDTLSIEVNTMKGSGKFELTGNMGNVMKESAKAGISYIRSASDTFNIDENFYKEKDIHIHIPEGAVPKDGPSAGITMATAMISALTGAKVRNDVAMTGEITIRGRVLPIGGLKEKAIAGKKAGAKTIIIPYDNKVDLEEISDEIKSGLEFIPVKDMNEVLKIAIVEGEKVWK